MGRAGWFRSRTFLGVAGPTFFELTELQGAVLHSAVHIFWQHQSRHDEIEGDWEAGRLTLNPLMALLAFLE